ncbi:F-box/kelch-repeat protein At3g06240-like [Henckelia pumila]|uniref:F-box/kelch-repeat protein At3g06240-like n=1 Tax=Henckelia pumila TaxID=405737 RepID=UPI003C6E7477
MAEPRLPMDMLIEVLILLPVKSILKFKCVSKTWRDLISSPVFIDRHLKCDRKQSILLVKRCLPPQNGEDVDQIFSFHDPDFPELLVSPNLSFPYIPSCDPSNLQIQGPCNGLVCIFLGNNVFMCNPALREFKQLPPLKFPRGYEGQLLGYGFGFVPIVGAYKVIQIREYEPPDLIDLFYDDSLANEPVGIQVDLYDSASNSWKKIDAKELPYITTYAPSVGVFTNGAIHWNAISAPGNRPCILCFDTGSETFPQMDVHENFPTTDEKRILLMGLDGSLAMVFWDYTDEAACDVEIWAMKEYGVKESWTKQFCIYPGPVYFPLLILKSERLVFVTGDGRLVACTIRGNQLDEFGIVGFKIALSAVVYQESLISLQHII